MNNNESEFAAHTQHNHSEFFTLNVKQIHTSIMKLEERKKDHHVRIGWLNWFALKIARLVAINSL